MTNKDSFVGIIEREAKWESLLKDTEQYIESGDLIHLAFINRKTNQICTSTGFSLTA